MIGISKEAPEEINNLDQVPYVYYFILFQKIIRKAEIMTLINFGNKINVMNPTYAAKQSL